MKWLKHLTNIFAKKDKKRYKNTAKTLMAGPPIAGEKRWGVVTHKFPKAYKKRIAQLIAQCETTHEVMATIKAETGLDVSNACISQYRKSKKWAPIIAKEKEMYLNNVADIPGYHEKIRLSRTDKIYRYAMDNNQPELALKTVEQQRKEVKEKPSGPVSLTFNQYNALSNEELEDKYNALLAKIEEKRKRKPITIEHKEVIDVNGGVEGKAGK